ncbi:hypothetical protein HPB52_024010 [Rhipicephalus sanguineus]|uniref:HTH psq-type domain-containing protein n=1 Tax=Rhipicephalus sanguineus TaxID=34632 RepID=A0A9D4PT08_RHISA|nr:hypothetical protein HPB52_024010 [Rhipicephalus sanguineus]
MCGGNDALDARAVTAALTHIVKEKALPSKDMGIRDENIEEDDVIEELEALREPPRKPPNSVAYSAFRLGQEAYDLHYPKPELLSMLDTIVTFFEKAVKHIPRTKILETLQLTVEPYLEDSPLLDCPEGVDKSHARDLIKRLTSYYGLALRSNTDVEDMKKAVMATFHNVSSTDAEPHHELCASGARSWCRHHAAEAEGKPQPPHTYNLPNKVAEALRPVYQRLSDPQLQARCTSTEFLAFRRADSPFTAMALTAPSSSSAPSKRTKPPRRLMMEKKAAIIKQVQSARSQTEVGREFGISKQTVLDFIKNKAKILEVAAKSTGAKKKNASHGVYLQLEEALLVRMVLCSDSGKSYAVNLRSAVGMLAESWKAVTQETLRNCFRHAGFTLDAETAVSPQVDSVCDELPSADVAFDDLRAACRLVNSSRDNL